MTTVSRRPLAARALSLQIPPVLSPLKRSISSTSKRARSPEPIAETKTKRAKVLSPGAFAAREEERKERERKKLEREAQKEEFRIKYTRAFPSWVFYFDLDGHDPDTSAVKEYLENKVCQLGGRVEDFFSNEVTHLVTNSSVPGDDGTGNKENSLKQRSTQKASGLLKSPIKLKRADDVTGYDNLVRKAIEFNIKIWSTTKLESVLERCLMNLTSNNTSQRTISVNATPPAPVAPQRSLTRLLESERLHGTTTERDPTQKRHDFRYFSRSSCFVLVEDMRQELATIHALEYPITKGRDGVEHGAWPVLHCHPQARGPFLEFDEREKKRWEKTQKAEYEKERELEQQAKRRQDALKRKAQAQRKAGDLRRSVSMSNFHRRASHDALPGGLAEIDGDADGIPDSANASGYLASGTGGYMAASGNSVGITSATGNTSTSTVGASLRSMKLPAALQERIQSQVVTSRKVSSVTGPTVSKEKQKDQGKKGTMGPPAGIPERPNGLLRKSKSTNTLRLPKREEGVKPGYCETCRMKFDDFKPHVQSRKHRKFAENDSNFLQLDFLLARVHRKTLREVEEERKEQEARRQDCVAGEPGDELAYFVSPLDDNYADRPWATHGIDADGDVCVN